MPRHKHSLSSALCGFCVGSRGENEEHLPPIRRALDVQPHPSQVPYRPQQHHGYREPHQPQPFQPQRPHHERQPSIELNEMRPAVRSPSISSLGQVSNRSFLRNPEEDPVSPVLGTARLSSHRSPEHPMDRRRESSPLTLPLRDPDHTYREPLQSVPPRAERPPSPPPLRNQRSTGFPFRGGTINVHAPDVPSLPRSDSRSSHRTPHSHRTVSQAPSSHHSDSDEEGPSSIDRVGSPPPTKPKARMSKAFDFNELPAFVDDEATSSSNALHRLPMQPSISRFSEVPVVFDGQHQREQSRGSPHSSHERMPTGAPRRYPTVLQAGRRPTAESHHSDLSSRRLHASPSTQHLLNRQETNTSQGSNLHPLGFEMPSAAPEDDSDDDELSTRRHSPLRDVKHVIDYYR